MYPTVRDILKLSELKECRLLHPEVTCSQHVKSVTIMDNPNILKWLSGYEILFTNGYNLVNFQNREWKQFFTELRQKNVTALFIKLSYFVDNLPQEIIAYTVSLDFPVVVVPNAYAWVTISAPINQFILQKQYYFIKEAADLRDRLNKVMLQSGSLTDICAVSAMDLSRPVALFDHRWNLITGCGDPLWAQVDSILLAKSPYYYDNLEAVELSKYPNHQLETSFGCVIFFSLPDLSTNKYLAVLHNDNQPNLTHADTYKIEQIASAMLLQLCKEAELNRIEKHYYTEFLFDLLDGVLTQKKEILEKTRKLGRKIHTAYQLITFNLPMAEPRNNLIDDLLTRFKKENSLIKDIMICRRETQVILFHPVVLIEDRQIAAKSCRLVCTCLKSPSMQFGVSQCYGLDAIHTGYREAMFALSAQCFVKRQVIYYEDLGLLRLFEINGKKADTPFLAQFYSLTIRPLADYDAENGASLVQTLEAFLKHNLSVSLTAKTLYIHENTLRARIRRIEAILDRSLKVPMDVAELLIGIQIHTLTN